MRQTFRNPLICVVTVVTLELFVIILLGGIARLPLPETAFAVLFVIVAAAGQIPVYRSAVMRVTVTSEGLTHHAMFTTRFTPWSEISAITLEEDLAGGYPVVICCPRAELRCRRFRWRHQLKLYALTSYDLPFDRPPRGRAVRMTKELETLRREHSGTATDR